MITSRFIPTPRAKGFRQISELTATPAELENMAIQESCEENARNFLDGLTDDAARVLALDFLTAADNMARHCQRNAKGKPADDFLRGVEFGIRAVLAEAGLQLVDTPPPLPPPQ